MALMKLIRQLGESLLKFKVRTRMVNPLTGRQMTGFFLFLEVKFDWDIWLEKMFKEVKIFLKKKNGKGPG